MRWSILSRMVPRDASKRLRTTCTRSALFRTSTSRRMGQIVVRVFATELVPSVSSSVTLKNSNRKENLLGKREKSSRVPGPHLPLKHNLTLEPVVALLPLSQEAGNMVASVARTWSNSGIMMPTSLGRRMIHMSSRISHLLRLLSLRVPPLLRKPMITSHSLRRKGIMRRRALRKVLSQIHHLKMRQQNQRRKRKSQQDQV